MILETERLILRPFAEGDAEDVYAYLSEPVVNCFASMRLNSLDAAKEEMKKRSSETEYYFAITLKDSGKVIGEIVMERLKSLEQVAYVRFASVYREFKDVNTFMNELKKMLDSNNESNSGNTPAE